MGDEESNRELHDAMTGVVKGWAPWCTRDRVLLALILGLGICNLLLNFFIVF